VSKQRTKYSVDCPDGEVAKFSSYCRAMDFAAAISREAPDYLIQVGTSSALVGQYKNGRTTPEFSLHHERSRLA
jgi:hypothetical protein